jgi:hypothetical protein
VKILTILNNNKDASNTEERHYLLRHADFKSFSSTSHVLVVLDVSSGTSNRLCLNDAVPLGRTILQDLYSMLLDHIINKINSSQV